MCAIAGFVGCNTSDEIIHQMLNTMLRRGPDGKGVFQSDECTLLHTRLAIIDPQNGQQPMELEWAGEKYIISYNGELYNTAEIKSKLQQLGHSFQSHSDTETLLHAYAQWGHECLQYLNGIFAFAVWNVREKKLFIARDRMGVKPLFYKLHENGILFASEIKTILSYPTVKAQLDIDGIQQVVLLGPGRIPGSGVFKNILEIEPGYYGVYDQGRFYVRQYWSLKDREHIDSFDDTVQHVRELVMDSVTRQTISDVPLGTFLSGGLDSSLITAICSQHFQSQGMQLNTFSVDYLNNEKYFQASKFQPDSDQQYIQIMNQAFLTNQHNTVLNSEQLIQSMKCATKARDLPGMADVDFSLLAFCGEIRKNVKVALSGECADEIFGGYPWYSDPEIRNQNGFPWAQNTAYRISFMHPEHVGKCNPQAFVNDLYSDTVSHTDVLPGTSAQEKRMKEMVNLNHRWFMQTLLDRKDRMSMYHGLEVRVPFCDYRIAEYLYGIPWEYKHYRGREKGLLRASMEGILPDKILWRKKSPYPKTFDPYYMKIVSAQLKEVISQPNAPIHQIIAKKALQELISAEYAWPWYGQLMKVPQTIAYMLQLNYWMTEYQIELV